jgi:HTH-type transcriptional regulator/antitoxin MqsA
MAKKKRQCPVCMEGHLERKKKQIKLEYLGYSCLVGSTALWCDTCDEGIYEGVDAVKADEQLAEFYEQIKTEIASDIKRIRLRLGLKQGEAGKIFGGGKNAFSRYETMQVEPPRSTVLLLGLLDKNPELLKQLPKN